MADYLNPHPIEDDERWARRLGLTTDQVNNAEISKGEMPLGPGDPKALIQMARRVPGLLEHLKLLVTKQNPAQEGINRQIESATKLLSGLARKLTGKIQDQPDLAQVGAGALKEAGVRSGELKKGAMRPIARHAMRDYQNAQYGEGMQRAYRDMQRIENELNVRHGRVTDHILVRKMQEGGYPGFTPEKLAELRATPVQHIPLDAPLSETGLETIGDILNLTPKAGAREAIADAMLQLEKTNPSHAAEIYKYMEGAKSSELQRPLISRGLKTLQKTLLEQGAKPGGTLREGATTVGEASPGSEWFQRARSQNIDLRRAAEQRGSGILNRPDPTPPGSPAPPPSTSRVPREGQRLNPQTGNFMDKLSDEYAVYKQQAGPAAVPFESWYRNNKLPGGISGGSGFGSVKDFGGSSDLHRETNDYARFVMGKSPGMEREVDPNVLRQFGAQQNAEATMRARGIPERSIADVPAEGAPYEADEIVRNRFNRSADDVAMSMNKAGYSEGGANQSGFYSPGMPLLLSHADDMENLSQVQRGPFRNMSEVTRESAGADEALGHPIMEIKGDVWSDRRITDALRRYLNRRSME